MAFLFRKSGSAETPYKHINVKQYRDEFGEAEHTLVDVRTVEEYQGGHLPGAINVPLHELQNRVQEIPRDKPVIVVCASGNRSMTGSEVLAVAGHQNVYNLQGGTMRWMMQGLPIDK